jgi:hypothetical protein
VSVRADVPQRTRGLGAIRGLTFWEERSPGFVLMVVDAPSTDCANMDWRYIKGLAAGFARTNYCIRWSYLETL